MTVIFDDVDRITVPVRTQREYFRDLASVLWQLCRDYSIDDSARWRAYRRIAGSDREGLDCVRLSIERIVAQARASLGRDATKLSIVERVERFGAIETARVFHRTIGYSIVKLDSLARLLMLPEWAENGFPVVQVGHKLAASLLVTRIPNDLVDAAELPWSVFEIELPSGMFSTVVDGEQHELAFMLAGRVTGPFVDGGGPGAHGPIEEMLGYAIIATAAPCSLWSVKRTIRELGDIEGVDLAGGVIYGPGHEDYAKAVALETTDADTRSIFLLSRLFANVSLMMTDKTSYRPIGKSHRQRSSSGSGRSSALPIGRVFQLSTSVRCDFRAAVAEYSRGERSALSVQGIVAGHWKRQVHGVGRSERKRIFVEPYWRGPEDAPIALRPHKLG